MAIDLAKNIDVNCQLNRAITILGNQKGFCNRVNNLSFLKSKQLSFRWCLKMIVPSLTHFDIVKRLAQVLKSCREQSFGHQTNI